jgi:hypothetical protein
MANGKPLGDKANGDVKEPLPDRHKVHKANGFSLSHTLE